MRQKTLMVRDFTKKRAAWRLTLMSGSQEALADIVAAVREAVVKHSLALINGNDPFGTVQAKTRKRRKREEGVNGPEKSPADDKDSAPF